MKKVHRKELIGVGVGIFTILAIMVISKPEFLQGNLQLSQLTTRPGQEKMDTARTNEKELSLPTVTMMHGSSGVMEGINSVMATAIENKADVKLTTIKMRLSVKELAVSNLRLMLNGKDVTSSLDKESQLTLSKELTTLTQNSAAKELTLTSSAGIDIPAGSNILELHGTYKGVKTTSTILTTMGSMTFMKDGVQGVVTLTQ